MSFLEGQLCLKKANFELIWEFRRTWGVRGVIGLKLFGLFFEF